MGLFDSSDRARLFENLLHKERAAILNCDYEAIQEIVAQKNYISTQLDRTRIEPQTLARLSQLSQKNSLLYDAMRAGIGNALERLRSIREPRQDLKTYDEAGQRLELKSAQSKNERRA